MSVTEEIAGVLDGCGRHGHQPSGVELPMSVYRDLVTETIRPEHWCFTLTDCGHEDCRRLREALQKRPGDDAGLVFGVKVHLIADQPRVRVIEEGAA